MKDPDKLKELILKGVDLSKVMLEYDVNFAFNPNAADEVQFRCPFHGEDNKPSSRYYRSTQTTYCWVCKERLNVIDFIKKKRGLGYYAALNYIIDRYKLDISNIPNDAQLEYEESKEVSKVQIDLDQIKVKIMDLMGTIPFERYNAICSAYLMLNYQVSLKKDVSESLSKLLLKLGPTI